ncbi:MAG: sugar kinase [Deltaproteobacteria bacterium]|nr:sugar kinase [Deltaproteobacteria bacterium]
MSLLVVGSVALDSVETPVEGRDEVLGGSASFFATVASLLVPVRLVAVVGEDFPVEHIEFLARRGVDLQGLQRVAGRTFRWAGRYLPNMVDRETLDTQLNVFEHFRPTLPASYRDSNFVFLANIDPALQLDVLRQVERPRLVACDTMNFWLRDRHLDAVKEVLRSVDLLILNDEEARLLSGQANLVKAVAAIRLLGVKRVIVKRGDAGAMLYGDEGIFWVPAFPLENVVDPTGAGDCFAGGFMSYLARTGDLGPANLRRAMVFGSATASFAVEDFSVDRFRTLEESALLERCQAFARLVRFEEVRL